MIINKTKNKVLINDTKFANSFLEKSVGLMFKRKIDYGLVFLFNIEKKLSFHTLFMNFPIDFLFLDKNHQVLKIVKNVKPWNFHISGKAKYVIELSAGKSSNTSVGDRISFK
jgi:uncharacterized protein